jgi:hypothetical protein
VGVKLEEIHDEVYEELKKRLSNATGKGNRQSP